MGGDPGMGGAEPPAMARRGFVTLREQIDSSRSTNRGSDVALQGEFKRYDRVPNLPMPVDVAGDCVLVRAQDANDPGDFVRLSAGDISFSGEQELILRYDDVGGGYSIGNVMVVDDDEVYDFWDGEGTVVNLDIAGSDRVGALATGDMASPLNITDMSPAPDGTLSRGGDAITWTPGNGTTVVVEILGGGVNERILCESDDDGEIEVPAAAFAWLPAENPASNWRINLTRRVEFQGETAAPETEVTVRLERISFSRNVSLEN